MCDEEPEMQYRHVAYRCACGAAYELNLQCDPFGEGAGQHDFACGCGVTLIAVQGSGLPGRVVAFRAVGP